MNGFFEFLRSFVIKAVIAAVIYFAFGTAALAISGDDTPLSSTESLIAFVVIVISANIIGGKISCRKKD